MVTGAEPVSVDDLQLGLNGLYAKVTSDLNALRDEIFTGNVTSGTVELSHFGSTEQNEDSYGSDPVVMAGNGDFAAYEDSYYYGIECQKAGSFVGTLQPPYNGTIDQYIVGTYFLVNQSAYYPSGSTFALNAGDLVFLVVRFKDSGRVSVSFNETVTWSMARQFN